MPKIGLETLIAAPAALCFDLIRDPSVQPAIVKVKGPAGVGQSITFAARGTRPIIVKVTEHVYPQKVVDTMIQGPFHSFVHEHEFREVTGGTLILDTIEWTSPFGIIGRVADSLLIHRRLTKLVLSRNQKLKELAENNGS
jgi:ligand-binding SRPBCC domain-containing protein